MYCNLGLGLFPIILMFVEQLSKAFVIILVKLITLRAHV